MGNEINALVSPEGEVTSAILATGSIVAGDWVFAYQTATDDMFQRADTNTYTTGSVAIQRGTAGSDDKVIGIALNNASSGETVNVAHEGVYIGVTAGSVTAGYPIGTQGQGVVDIVFDAGGTGSAYVYKVGRALTGASDTAKYVLFKLNP